MVTGSFTGLNLSLRALYSSRKALNVTGENVANANTEGYTRKVAEFKTFGQNAAGISEPVFGFSQVPSHVCASLSQGRFSQGSLRGVYVTY